MQQPSRVTASRGWTRRLCCAGTNTQLNALRRAFKNKEHYGKKSTNVLTPARMMNFIESGGKQFAGRYGEGSCPELSMARFGRYHDQIVF